jgi:hypothetical protein
MAGKNDLCSSFIKIELDPLHQKVAENLLSIWSYDAF